MPQPDGSNINPTPVVGRDKTYSVHVRGVPAAAWRNARQCALVSGVSFKDFVIHLLQTSNPVRAVGVGAAVAGREAQPEPPTAETCPAVAQDTAHHPETGGRR